MEQLFKAIQAIAEANPDGFTVDLTTLKKVTKGISVAYLETQDSFGEEGLKRVLNHALMHERKSVDGSTKKTECSTSIPSGFSLISKKPSNSDVKMGRSLFSTLGK